MPPRQAQPRAFRITLAGRRGANPITWDACERHGAQIAAEHGVRLHEETHLRQLTITRRARWGEITIVAWPAGASEPCTYCESEREREEETE